MSLNEIITDRYPEEVKINFFKYLLNVDPAWIESKLYWYPLTIESKHKNVIFELPINSVQNFEELRKIAQKEIRKIKLDKLDNI